MSAGRSGGLTWTEGPIQLSQPFAFVPQPDPDRQPYVAPHYAFIVRDKRRFAAVQQLGWTMVPIVVTDVRQHPEQLADRIADHLVRASIAS